jgi:hypothetical protein
MKEGEAGQSPGCGCAQFLVALVVLALMALIGWALAPNYHRNPQPAYPVNTSTPGPVLSGVPRIGWPHLGHDHDHD